MQLIVAATRSNDPEVHAAGCADVTRGRKSGKYQFAYPLDVGQLDEAGEWFWSDFLDEESMTAEQAQSYTKYLPCALALEPTPTKKESTMTTATAEKPAATETPEEREARHQAKAVRDADAAAQKKAEAELTGKPAPKSTSRASKAADKAKQDAAKTPKPKPKPKPAPKADPKPKPAPEPEGLSPLARKRLVAAQLVTAAADLAVDWDDEDVDAAEARELIRVWISYLPIGEDGWDARLGERSTAGRRPAKAAK